MQAYHPALSFIYFAFVIGFSMFFLNPLCLAISVLSSFAYSVIIGGRKALRENVKFVIPLAVLAAVINPLFNHEGQTVLAYFPNGNPLTLESICSGCASAAMLAAVIFWFSCFNKIMTGDKIMYIFGRISPSFSLIISMTLRFVPRFKEHLREISLAQRALHGEKTHGTFGKIKDGIKIVSAMLTWCFENSIDTADSMKSRGFGSGKRVAYTNYVFERRDFFMLWAVICGGVYIFIGCLKGAFRFVFFPTFSHAERSAYFISVFAVYALFSAAPIIIEIWEVLRWKKLKSKI